MALTRLHVGSIFARDFLVEGLLSEGGMGAVYRAEQRSTGRKRALKIMRPELLADPKARERFVNEARVGARIESDHVVEVIAAGVDEATGTPWLAMELLNGHDLSHAVAIRGALPWTEAREVLLQACDAIGAAHRVGIVHCDLKPENLFVAQSRSRGDLFKVKVLDFGIARLIRENLAATMTTAMGSPLFMAPEQAKRGDHVRPATDVWALGLVAFHVLTARHYWPAGNVPASDFDLLELMAEIARSDLESASVRARSLGVQGGTLPEGFDAWFARCVTRSPSARFADADEAAKGIEAVGTASAAPRARPRQHVATGVDLPSMDLSEPLRPLQPPPPTPKAPAASPTAPAPNGPVRSVVDLPSMKMPGATPARAPEAPAVGAPPPAAPRPIAPTPQSKPHEHATAAPSTAAAHPVSGSAAKVRVEVRPKWRKVIGIDLGTSKSVVAVMRGARPHAMTGVDGSASTPSVVSWSNAGEVIVGSAAKREAVLHASSTVFSVHRHIGQLLDEPIAGRVIEGSDVSAIVVKTLKDSAEAWLQESVTEAVVTVPARFDVISRAAVRDACARAGLNVRRILGHAEAAALAYGRDKRADQLIAVYDLGGGTFDVSIVEVSENLVEVKSTDGDRFLGGDDVDQRITEHLTAEFRKEHGVGVALDDVARQRLRDASEKAKVELSSMQETTVSLPYISAAGATPLHMNVRLTRSKLEQMIEDLVERSLDVCRRALKDAEKSQADISEVVLVGGSTRIPLVQKKVKEFFGKDPNRSMNPDEVVALGAAVQGAMLTGEVMDMLLLDVIPLSLGVETKGGIFSALIPRNTPIPYSRSEIFSTASDDQTQIEVHVLQGERPMARENTSLGRFELKGIPPAPQGVPKIKVSFEIDANGILHVTARDESTGSEHKVTMTGDDRVAHASVPPSRAIVVRDG